MRFIVLGDLHFTDYATEVECAKRDRFFGRLFEAVAGQKADLVFAIGDIVHDGRPSEIEGLYRLARTYGIELISLTGNHDTAALPKADLRSYFIGGKSSEPELYYAFSLAGTRFVLLDSGREMLCETDWSGYISPEQQSWLAREVRAFEQKGNGDQYLAVMGHHPIYGTTEFSTKDKLNITNSDEVKAVLGKVRPGEAIYICGHNHTHSIFGPDAAGWTYVQCGAPLVSFSFRVFEVAEVGWGVRTVWFGLDDPQLVADLPVIYAELEYFASLSLEEANGEVGDQVRVFGRGTTENTEKSTEEHRVLNI